jgi:hypothetical protein
MKNKLGLIIKITIASIIVISALLTIIYHYYCKANKHVAKTVSAEVSLPIKMSEYVNNAFTLPQTWKFVSQSGMDKSRVGILISNIKSIVSNDNIVNVTFSGKVFYLINGKEDNNEMELRVQFNLLSKDLNIIPSNFKIISLDSYDSPDYIKKTLDNDKNNIYVKLDSIVSAYSLDISGSKCILDLKDKNYNIRIDNIFCDKDDIHLMIKATENSL